VVASARGEDSVALRGHPRWRTPNHRDRIWSFEAFSRILRCPLEIPRLVAPPVGDHRARIAAPLGARAVRLPAPADPDEVLATEIRPVTSVANLAMARNGESIVRSPPVARRRGGHDLMTAAPVTLSHTAIERPAVTTVTSARETLSVALDRAVPDETIEPRRERHRERRRVTAERRAATTPRGPLAKADIPRTIQRAEHLDRTIARTRNARRALHDLTLATTPSRESADRVCRRATDHPRARGPSGPGN
jgi:hypothetical protein